jgi:chromosomal replication initiation ATPase DnaA
MKKLEELKTAVCRAADIDSKTLTSKSRLHNIVLARQLFCYIAFAELLLKTGEIGREIGYADRSSVSIASKVFSDFLHTKYYPAVRLYNKFLKQTGKSTEIDRNRDLAEN